MNINLKLRLPEPPKKAAKPSASTSARLPGEKAVFKEMTQGVRNLVPSQTWDSARGITLSSRPHETVKRETSIDDRFQAFLAGEARQRQALNLLLRGQEYRAQFLINCMSAE